MRSCDPSPHNVAKYLSNFTEMPCIMNRSTNSSKIWFGKLKCWEWYGTVPCNSQTSANRLVFKINESLCSQDVLHFSQCIRVWSSVLWKLLLDNSQILETLICLRRAFLVVLSDLEQCATTEFQMKMENVKSFFLEGRGISLGHINQLARFLS
jgi:hypothetical protein